MEHTVTETGSRPAIPITPGGVERRERMQQAIARLMERRRQVMVAYCELAGLEELSDNHLVCPRLRKLCQLMIDYTALGHFEVYQRIVEGNERRAQLRATAERVYPALAETTDVLVDFNDKYDVLDGTDAFTQLHTDLSRLGETFAVRIELEDAVFAALGERPAAALS